MEWWLLLLESVFEGRRMMNGGDCLEKLSRVKSGEGTVGSVGLAWLSSRLTGSNAICLPSLTANRLGSS